MYMGLAYFVYTFMRVAIGDSKSPEESPLPEILSQKPGQEEQTYTWRESCPWSPAQGSPPRSYALGVTILPKNPDTPLETFISARPRGAMVEAL